jgi:hypothetical protein
LTYAEDDYKILCPACAQQMRAYAGRQSRSDPGTKPSEAPRKPKGAFKFTLRDLFWLVLLVACLCGWWLGNVYWASYLTNAASNSTPSPCPSILTSRRGT